jgi:hypothetical protein
MSVAQQFHCYRLLKESSDGEKKEDVSISKS